MSAKSFDRRANETLGDCALTVQSGTREWQYKLPCLTTESPKAVVTVEGLRLIILRINDQSENGDFRSQRSLNGTP